MRSPIKKGQIRAKGSKSKSGPGRIDNSKNVLDIADNTTFIRSQVLTCVSNTFQIVCWLKLLWRCGTLWFALQISLSCHRTWHFTNPSASTTTYYNLVPKNHAWAKPKWKSHWVPGGTAQLILFLRLWLPFPTSFFPALVDMIFPCWLDYPPPYMRTGMLPHLLTYTRW